MRHGTTHGKARFSNSGRHAAAGRARRIAPRQLNKLVKRAALVAPAVAFAGAVVATTTSHGLAADALSDAAGHVSASAHAGTSASPATSGHGHAHQAGAKGTSSGPRAAKSRSAAAKSHRSGSGSGQAPSHRARPANGKPSKQAKRSGQAALTCSGSSVMLPENYAAIVSYLTAHGYTRFAAAGIAGNIYQESKGNPESVGTGGGGLIGWTPLPPGFVTGSPAADLRTQLAAILTYNQQWAQYIPALNAATSATQAADVYMNYFERPGIPAAYNREAAAAAVASACGF